MKVAIMIGLMGIALLAPVEVEAAAQGGDAAVRNDARPTSGYSGGFFVEDAEGRFRLRLNGEGHIRWVGNNLSEAEGFQLRRTRFDLRGHIFDPRIGYRVRVGFGPGDNFSVEHAYLSYGLTSAVNVKAGQFKPAFIREEVVNGMLQLTVERSYTADYFTVDFTEGAELIWEESRTRISASIHDGSYQRSSEFTRDATRVGSALRAEWKPAGAWRQFNDFTNALDADTGVLIGAAVDYEVSDEVVDAGAPDIFKYTFDVSVETGRWSGFAAWYGQQVRFPAPGALSPFNAEVDQNAAVIQGGLRLTPPELEIFGRYETLDLGGLYLRRSAGGLQGGSGVIPDERRHLVTAGFNYYAHLDQLKWTLDVIRALDGLPVANSGNGLGAGAGPQTAIRGQVQWRF